MAAGGSLTLENLTLQGGKAYGFGVAAHGGAIYSAGRLTLDDVIVQNNRAEGLDYAVGPGAGGGIYSAGELVVQDSVFRNNTAQGGNGGNGLIGNRPGARGGLGSGGAAYVAGGTVTLTQVAASSNTAQGGHGGVGKTMGATGAGAGGGIFISSLSNSTADVYLDAFTVAHVTGNTAASQPNISGPYTLV